MRGMRNILCAVPVTNTLVSPVEQDVVGNLVLVDVTLDLLERPVGEGVDLDQPCIVNLDDIQVTPLSTLAAAASRQDRLDLQIAVRPLSRLDLGQVVVVAVVGLPQAFAMQALEVIGSLAVLGFEDVDVDIGVSLLYPIHELEGLLEVVEGIQED